jgi:adenosylmethionine-8-amino-7-oxononanoate aminotransferase
MNDLLKGDREKVWHPFSPFLGMPEILAAARGEGPYIITEDGRRILDAVSSWWVNLHGHAHPRIAEAIAKQAHTLEQVIFAGFTHTGAVKLAEKLLELLPENQSRIFFSDDGSTAIEAALKLCFQFWYNQGLPRKKVIAISGAYHGDTFGAMSVGERDTFVKPFESQLFHVDFIPFPQTDNQEEVCNQFDRYCADGEVAAFIFEPLIQGASGMRIYEATVLNQLMQISAKYGIPTIADEVMTGFGRLGTNFASDQLEQAPDLICLSKGITGGFLPLGATSVAQHLVDAFWTDEAEKSFLHGHSYTGNPLACAAALSSLDILLEPECQNQIQHITEKHRQFVDQMNGHPGVKEVRSIGTILAVELDTGGDSGYFNASRHAIYEFFLKRDILLRPLGNIIYLLPPYVITDKQLDTVYDAIKEYLSAK